MYAFLFTCLVGLTVAQGPVDPNAIPCGVPTVQPITSRIVGGQPATIGSWPWTVLLADALGFISGSAILIHPHVLMTSAQHFEGPGYTIFDMDIRYWRVYAGEYNISTKDPNEKYYHINRVVLHPGYNGSSLENDIALIITNEAIAYNDHTRPLCLPDASHTYTIGETCYMSGWGSTKNTGDEEVMNQLAMPILDDSVCKNIWQDFISGTEICAGFENGGKDFCVDDIGGPFACKDANGAWYAQGIASSGGACDTNGSPGIFEDVTLYSDWVKKTMEDAGYNYAY